MQQIRSSIPNSDVKMEIIIVHEGGNTDEQKLFMSIKILSGLTFKMNAKRKAPIQVHTCRWCSSVIYILKKKSILRQTLFIVISLECIPYHLNKVKQLSQVQDCDPKG